MLDPDAALHGPRRRLLRDVGPPVDFIVAAARFLLPAWVPPPSLPPLLGGARVSRPGAVFSLGPAPKPRRGDRDARANRAAALAGVRARRRLLVSQPGERQGALGTKFVLAEGVLAICPLATSTQGFELAACVGVRADCSVSGGSASRPPSTRAIHASRRRSGAGYAGESQGPSRRNRSGLLVPVLRDRFYFARPRRPKSRSISHVPARRDLEGGSGGLP